MTNQLIKDRLGQLLSTSKDIDEGLIFLGNPHEAYPRRLPFDRHLDHLDVRLWLMLKDITKDQMMPFPKYDHIMDWVNIKSRTTLSRSIKSLRANRWISLIDVIRDKKGYLRGKVYALHAEPLNVETAVELDPTYPELVSTLLNDRNQRLRDCGARLSQELGVTITHPQSPKTIAQHDLSNMLGGHGLGLNHTESTLNENLNTIMCCKNPTVHIVDSGMSPFKKPKSTLWTQDPLVHNVDCSSSYLYNKTTTTTAPKRYLDSSLFVSEKINPDEHPLIAITMRGQPLDIQQQLLDEVAGRIRKGKQIDSVTGYIGWMIKHLKSGENPFAYCVHEVAYRKRVQENQRSNAHHVATGDDRIAELERKWGNRGAK